MTTLYHLSPENFSVFTPKYHRPFCIKGIYVSRLRSTIYDWMPYVFGKKGKKDKNPKKRAHYSHIYIYTLSCPKKVFEEIKKFYNDVYNSREWSDDTLFGFWLWGEQYYIPEYLLKHIKIVSKKTVDYSTFLDMVYHH